MKAQRLLLVAGWLALVAMSSSTQAWADGMATFDGYEAFYRTWPGPLFTPADEKPLDDTQSFEGKAFRAWGPLPADGGRRAPGTHRIEVLGPDMSIDDRALPAARAKIFPGEHAAEVGPDARLYVGARDVCIQGVAPSSSGTAQRHVHVRLVTDAFTPRARRYDLPALFGSCLAVTRGTGASLRFPAASYHTPGGAALADGAVFTIWRLHGGVFTRTNESTRVSFPDPENVYRFVVLDR